ncbi:hypothetical protein [Paenibacillus sp. NPDC058174]|uniref:hypothetical protein n=1 Tax=Paenibacillus sp. NPDC058174 TaxID=3346366 RepID=UPI0036DB0C6B
MKTKEAALQNPYYQKELISASRFFQESYVELTDLGVHEDFITVVHVFSDELKKNYWLNAGGTFLLTDDRDKLILFLGNVYFAMERSLEAGGT